MHHGELNIISSCYKSLFLVRQIGACFLERKECEIDIGYRISMRFSDAQPVQEKADKKKNGRVTDRFSLMGLSVFF